MLHCWLISPALSCCHHRGPNRVANWRERWSLGAVVMMMMDSTPSSHWWMKFLNNIISILTEYFIVKWTHINFMYIEHNIPWLPAMKVRLCDVCFLLGTRPMVEEPSASYCAWWSGASEHSAWASTPPYLLSWE